MPSPSPVCRRAGTPSPRIRGSNASTIDPALLRSYLGGPSDAIAARSVFLEIPSVRAINLIASPSARCSRRHSQVPAGPLRDRVRGCSRAEVQAQSSRSQCCVWQYGGKLHLHIKRTIPSEVPQAPTPRVDRDVLSNLFVIVPTVAVAVFIFFHAGTIGVMLGMESIIATGGLLYGLVRCGRWYRGVKPPDPSPRSKD